MMHKTSDIRPQVGGPQSDLRGRLAVRDVGICTGLQLLHLCVLCGSISAAACYSAVFDFWMFLVIFVSSCCVSSCAEGWKLHDPTRSWRLSLWVLKSHHLLVHVFTLAAGVWKVEGSFSAQSMPGKFSKLNSCNTEPQPIASSSLRSLAWHLLFLGWHALIIGLSILQKCQINLRLIQNCEIVSRISFHAFWLLFNVVALCKFLAGNAK